MSSNWIGMGIEVTVAILLVITIGYCMMLNSRLRRLRADEGQLKSTILELVKATEIAERAIHGLKQAAQDCDQTLARRVREAEFFSVEIAREIGEGEQVLDRIMQIIKTVRSAPAQPAAASAGVRAVEAAVAPQPERTSAAPAAMDADTGRIAAPKPARMSDLKLKFAQSAERLASIRKGIEGQAA
jgi:hypothetical protein